MNKINNEEKILTKIKSIPNTVGHRGEIDRNPLEFTTNRYNDFFTINKNFNKQIPKSRLNIGTLNTRTLKTQESLLELENALKALNWDILGLSEVRRADENIEVHDDYIFYYKNITAGLYGVGFMW